MTNIAVGFAGSGFLCPAEAGALVALDKAGVRIPYTSGTSGGSIVAAHYALHQDALALSNLVKNADFAPLMNFGSPWTWPMHALRLARQNGWCNPAPIEAFFHQIYGFATFADLDIDLMVTATCLETQTLRVFSRQNSPHIALADAVRCSTSIPGVYPPKELEGLHYVDGGLTLDFPANLLPNGPDKAYCVVLTGNHHANAYQNNLQSLIAANVNALLDSQHRLDRESAPWVTFIEVFTGTLDVLDSTMPVQQREWLMEQGQKAVEAQLAAEVS